jgi:hypothetical protein
LRERLARSRRATRFVYLEILPDRRAATAAAFSTTPNATPTSTPSLPTTITRLRCLDYQAPAELLAKLAGHNIELDSSV